MRNANPARELAHIVALGKDMIGSRTRRLWLGACLLPLAAQAQAQTYTKTETIEYHDNLSLWVLGQPSKLTVNGIIASETLYDSRAQPRTIREFGRTAQTLTYHPDGTVATVADGRGNVTTLSNWKRGIPQTIRYPATPESPSGATQSAVVNDAGWITRVTDENGYATNYQHDAMGRITRIQYPTGDSVAWHDTTFSFVRAGAAAYGLPAGHWQHSESTGQRRKITYLDALWRPVLVREYDNGNVAGTQRFIRQAFDHEGRVTFASYPSASGTPNTGTWTEYDALGRPTSVSQDSELGLLTTTTAYAGNADGYYTLVTSPKGEQTRTWYQAFDQPSYDWPVEIWHPNGAYTDIARDAFGKPVSITRRNNTGTHSLTRRYVYDAHQQLCKSVEPETGATIMAYDEAGNLVWSKSGATQTGAACNTGDVPVAERTVRSYDARNRVLSLAFPDNLGNTVYGYYPDGRLASVAADNGGADVVSTAYTYNRRRLPTGEALSVGAHQWAIGYGYNANGALATLTLPGGESVDQEPNALGQPTRVGVHASGVSYFPNGAVKQFTYGNGIVRTFTQNARGLPERSRDAYGGTAVHDDSVDYDSHGNVAAISDGLSGGRGDRTMAYDGLDRLTRTVSPMFGTATYGYDVLDNLTGVQLTAGPKQRNHAYVYDTRNRLDLVTSAGTTVASLTYDAQGNLKTHAGRSYQFDYGNRLRSVVGQESYLYDGHGRRVKATRQGGGAIYSVYGQDGVLRYQRDERAGRTTEYIHLEGSLIAQLEDPIALSTPALTVPGYSATGAYTVSWTSAALANRYELRERVDGGAWATIHNAARTQVSLSGKAAGTWGYQVRACSTSACGNWSPVAETTVQLPPGAAPALSVPATGLNGAYTITWTGVAAAATYQLQERQGTGGWSTIHDAAATSKALSGKAAGTWSYQVRACNAAGCGGWSAVSSVNVIHPPGGAPALTVPATSNNGSYTVSWTGVSGSARYELEERHNNGSWTVIHNGAATSKAVSGRGAGTWSYRVRACNTAGCGAWSGTASVSVVHPPASAPTVTTPASNNSGGYTVTWTSVASATKYELQEQFNSGSWSTIHDGPGTSKAVSGKATGAWSYRARACNTGGCGGWSALRTTQVLRPPSSAPQLTTPASNTTGTYVVTWSAVASATHYELEERKGTAAWGVIQSSSATSHTRDAQTPGAYDYRARACNAGGCSAYSAIMRTQVSLPLPVPTLSAPATASMDSTFNVSWTSVAGATRYELQQKWNDFPWGTVHDAPSTSVELRVSVHGRYRYRVKACGAASCSAYSPERIVDIPRSIN
ncbi:RHS repeat protein [Luteimonas huabeiensis]|uniref:RHS repeat protein n=1 Tax=Luteimonas huabeiensis TaxID=1244513 RepID=UPI0005BB989F|nr:RHS repeat protein [Luteimonas huabeiensis]